MADRSALRDRVVLGIEDLAVALIGAVRKVGLVAPQPPTVTELPTTRPPLSAGLGHPGFPLALGRGHGPTARIFDRACNHIQWLWCEHAGGRGGDY